MVISHRWTEVDGRTKTDRPPHGRIRTMDQENNFEVDHMTDFRLHGRVRTTDDKHFYHMDGGRRMTSGRVDG